MASHTERQPVQQKSRDAPATTADTGSAGTRGRPQWKQRPADSLAAVRVRPSPSGMED